MKNHCHRLMLLILLTLPGPLLHGEEVLVAAASNFTRPLQELARMFREQSGHELQLAFGSSGRLYAQILNGAPYQVFLSADEEKPDRLEKQGLTVPGSRITYARGRLLLWSASRAITGPDVLRKLEGKLALANPELAPYGRAAEQVLENLELKQATQASWVLGENIAQTFQFVETGNALMGFVAASQLAGRQDQANAWPVASNLHEPIRQDGVLLKRAESCAACAAFMDFLQSDQARNLIRAMGYDL
ncbi:MAG: molybdate ABC transporter substrate-binding protein [Pseudomonadales bacterium]|nr:molybdate ABC transporter substrate-binding protein [Pseudomonadales bacterium]